MSGLEVLYLAGRAGRLEIVEMRYELTLTKEFAAVK